MSDFSLQQNQILGGNQEIKLRILGEEMNAEEGYKLDTILTSLNSFQNLVNKTYLYINERERRRESDQEDISIRLLSVEEGSFLSTLEIVYNDVLVPTLPLLIDNKEMIWGSIKLAFDFIKAKTNAIREGKEVMVTQTASENGMNVVNNSTGTVNITVNNGIPDLSEKLRSEFHNMTRSIDGDKVSGIEISGYKDDAPVQTLSLDNNDKNLFRKTTYTEDNVMSIVGKIIDGNYSYKNGRIMVEDSSAIPAGEYKFSVSENLHAEDKWREMFLQERPYYCRRRMEHNPATNEFNILEIVITDWDESQWN